MKDHVAMLTEDRREYMPEVQEKKGLKRSASQMSLDETKATAARVKLIQMVWKG